VANKRKEPRDQLTHEFISALTLGDPEKGRDLVRRAVRDQDDLRHVYLKALEPAHREVLRLEQEGAVRPAEAHLMTMVIQELIDDFAELVFADASNGPKALVASMPGELYDVTARLVADLLEMEGFDTTFTSSPENADEIVAELTAEKFDIFVLVVTEPSMVDDGNASSRGCAKARRASGRLSAGRQSWHRPARWSMWRRTSCAPKRGPGRDGRKRSLRPHGGAEQSRLRQTAPAGEGSGTAV
jgi:hypothetical protein